MSRSSRALGSVLAAVALSRSLRPSCVPRRSPSPGTGRGGPSRSPGAGEGRWVLLAAIPSTWMLAVTAYFTTVIRPIPLLWVIPLALYLFSFAIVFARRP